MNEVSDVMIKDKQECIYRLQQFINEFQQGKIAPDKMHVLVYSISKLYCMLEREEKSNKAKDRK